VLRSRWASRGSSAVQVATQAAWQPRKATWARAAPPLPSASPPAGDGTDRNGLDVDARFLLANERTLLAWVRTALALLAGGVALDHVGDGGSATGSFLLVLAGAATAGTGASRYRSADRSLRAGLLPPTGHAPYVIVVAVIALAAVLLVVLVLS
jgi:putative membrane protein